MFHLGALRRWYLGMRAFHKVFLLARYNTWLCFCYYVLFLLFFISLLCLFAAGAGQTNTTARSNTAGETRAPPPAGLGGLALPDLEGMLGGMPDAASLNQMMQNPAVSQMMQSLLSNPQYMNQVEFVT